MMAADAFFVWSEQQEGYHELIEGAVVRLPPDRSIQNLTKGAAYFALSAAVKAKDLPCELLAKGLGVQVDDHAIYLPDALVRCGERLPRDAQLVPDPVIVVEILSPEDRALDFGRRFMNYFRLPSLRHLLVVDPEARTIMHHRKLQEGDILTCVHRREEFVLDPPGIFLKVDDFFARLS